MAGADVAAVGEVAAAASISTLVSVSPDHNN